MQSIPRCGGDGGIASSLRFLAMTAPVQAPASGRGIQIIVLLALIRDCRGGLLDGPVVLVRERALRFRPDDDGGGAV